MSSSPVEDESTSPLTSDLTISPQQKEKLRSIGRWFIGETLGKGGYSWVKKGYDKKTGKTVALKFMAKAEKSWADEQTKQVITEIESLKQIKHPNVMKLYAYNLNAKYPTKNKEKLDTILLVLEFAPGGELFDILYYTSALEEEVARTYFLQMVAGIEACHEAGIAHRDIKPQNLLLDSHFNLKLTDFGLSKVFESDSDTLMKTTYVGTRGYQAPELLLNRPYDLSCDIFSAGVVLFILLTGYPPFEQAQKKDRWYEPLSTGDTARFWKAHRGCSIAGSEKVKDLIQRMLCFDPKKRITINEIKEHPWCTEKILDGKELLNVLRTRHRKMESKRKVDAKKLSELQQSVPRREIIFNLADAPLFPESEVEGIYAYDMYTTTQWKEALNYINDVLANKGALVESNPNESRLIATIKGQQNIDDIQGTCLIKVEISLWRSREFANPVQQSLTHPLEQVSIVRVRRLEGDVVAFKQITQTLIQSDCALVLTGLPKWAEEQKGNNVGIAKIEQIKDDDYEDILKEGLDFEVEA